MLPMGTIMALTMLLGVLFATRLPLLNVVQKLPRAIIVIVALILLLAGGWNVFWYAFRNIGEFWGNAALIGGSLQILAAGYIAIGQSLPIPLLRIRAVAVLALFCCALLYSITIYQL